MRTAIRFVIIMMAVMMGSIFTLGAASNVPPVSNPAEKMAQYLQKYWGNEFTARYENLAIEFLEPAKAQLWCSENCAKVGLDPEFKFYGLTLYRGGLYERTLVRWSPEPFWTSLTVVHEAEHKRLGRASGEEGPEKASVSFFLSAFPGGEKALERAKGEMAPLSAYAPGDQKTLSACRPNGGEYLVPTTSASETFVRELEKLGVTVNPQDKQLAISLLESAANCGQPILTSSKK